MEELRAIGTWLADYGANLVALIFIAWLVFQAFKIGGKGLKGIIQLAVGVGLTPVLVGLSLLALLLLPFTISLFKEVGGAGADESVPIPVVETGVITGQWNGSSHTYQLCENPGQATSRGVCSIWCLNPANNGIKGIVEFPPTGLGVEVAPDTCSPP